MNGFLSAFAPLQDLLTTIGVIFPYTWFLVLPAALLTVFLFLWMDYVWDAYVGGLRFTLLEIVPPRDIEKSPLPMELIFDALASTEKTSSMAEEYLVGE